ncbi:MAG TPA: CoA transferase [Candidatus Acidoferrales bacterium]|nr:CoA transferase [Candidatus Acidoferrales bacterium]
MAARFLEGYRALDLADLKGQLCGRVLADLGMEVVKIEPPGGDPVRNLAPFKSSPEASLSLLFAHLNANKASTVLDLGEAGGREKFLRLVEKADVVLESFAPGLMASLGLGYERLAGINPGLVMASITGFGQTGPRANYACSDIVALAMGGLLYVGGDPSLPPCKPPETQAYYFASLFAALGVVAALYRRRHSGTGDHIDVSMQETLATQEHAIRLYANEGQIIKRQGSQHGQVAPARIFPCRDGFVYLYVTRQHWKLFLQAWPDHPPEMEGPEWENNLFRRSRVDELNPLVEAFTRKHTTRELTELLQARGIPCVPVNKPNDFTADEHVRSRNFIVPVEYPDLGTVRQPAAPYLIDGSRPGVAPAPARGSWRESDPAPTGSRETSARDGAPLEGMRIVSFDHVLAGPYGTTLLAELGADVIKVESRRGGLDPFRFFGTGEDPNRSPRFFEFNRNKRSVTVNLKKPSGPRIIKDLARRADAVLDNFSVDVMAKLGLAYDDLRRVKPDIIVLRMPGLGATGPKRYYSTVGVNITAFTGLTYLWNHPGHTDPPIGSQTVYPDYVSGVLAAILVVSGVLYRERSRRGAAIDISQAEATAFMIGSSLTQAETLGQNPEPIGNHSPYCAPHDCYRCKGEDRWCAIAAETDEQWRALANLIDPELAADQRFATIEDRLDHRAELSARIEKWTLERDPHDVMESLQRHGIPCGVVQNGADLVNDPHLKERGFIVEVQNPRLGRVVLPGFPLRFKNAKLNPRWEFPELGRDTEKVLREVLGYSDAEIEALANEGVLE